ncbi:MAG: hypothetical protein ACRDPK_10300 [Carbonactinosporaceae bacterium]
MFPIPSGAIAAASLIAGFAVADLTGVRPLGGGVLLVGAALCWPRWRRAAGARAAVGLVMAFAMAFALAHPLAGVVGAWPSVLIVSAAMAAAAWTVADRRAHPQGTTSGAPAPRG